jgi:TPR repeat protein
VAIPACETALAAAPENPRLLFQMGRACGSVKEFDKARDFYEKAARLGYASAQVDLGILYEYGLGGVPRDDREAVRFFKLAADQGYADAQNNLGNFYAQGRGGLTKNDQEAVRFYRLATAQGNAVAQATLANFYKLGRGGLAKTDVADANDIARLLRTQIFACWKPSRGRG